MSAFCSSGCPASEIFTVSLLRVGGVPADCRQRLRRPAAKTPTHRRRRAPRRHPRERGCNPIRSGDSAFAKWPLLDRLDRLVRRYLAYRPRKRTPVDTRSNVGWGQSTKFELDYSLGSGDPCTIGPRFRGDDAVRRRSIIWRPGMRRPTNRCARLRSAFGHAALQVPFARGRTSSNSDDAQP